MSKCGSTMPSISLIRASRLFFSSSLRPSRALARSSAMPCTTAFGSLAARAGGATSEARPRKNAKLSIRNIVDSSSLARRRLGGIGGFVGLAGIGGVGFLRIAVADQVFADQLFQLDGVLHQHHFVAVLEILRRAARLQTNVLVAQ